MSDAKEFLDFVSDLLSGNPNADIDLSADTPLAAAGLS